jgi:hypothetical protein
LTALIFYRVRHFEQEHVKAIIEAVQPYRARTISPASEVEYFKGLIQELQTDICRSHELMCRLWLNTSFGHEWLREVSEARKASHALPRATPERIARDFAFTPQEIRSLWTPIVSAAYPEHWVEQSWDEGLCDDYIFESMEAASYVLIAKMVTGLHIGVRAHRTTNVSARLKMLVSISNLDAPDRWPQLPVDGTALPDTPEGWKGYPDFYPVCLENPDFAAIFARFGETGTEIFTKLAGIPFPEPERPQSPIAADPDTQTETQQPETVDLTQVTESSQNGPQQPSIDGGSQPSAQQDTAGAQDDIKIEQDVEDVDPQYDTHEELLVDQDGNTFTMATYDDEDEPAQSGWIHTGDETEKHDSEALQYLAHIAGANKEEDYRVVNEWLTYNQPDLSFITTRAFDLARLGNLGLARYAMDDLRIDADMYGTVAERFAQRRIDRLAEAAALADVLKIEQEKLADLEAEAAKYRHTSGIAATTQQNITQTRRLQAKVQAQVKGARLSMAGTARVGRSASMAPPGRRGSDTPSIPGRSTVTPTPSIPGRSTLTPTPSIPGRSAVTPFSRQTTTPTSRGRGGPETDPLQTPTPTSHVHSAPDTDPHPTPALPFGRRRSGAEFDESDWAK